MIPREQAEAAIKIAVLYLREQEKGRDKSKAPELLVEPEHWEDTARWARDLLEAANRSDWSGCPLCRS